MPRLFFSLLAQHIVRRNVWLFLAVGLFRRQPAPITLRFCSSKLSPHICSRQTQSANGFVFYLVLEFG